jgi:hypothetical protein
LINSQEKVGSRYATTPNQLYKAIVILPNAIVIKDPAGGYFPIAFLICRQELILLI